MTTYADALATLTAKLVTGARGSIRPEDVAAVVQGVTDVLNAQVNTKATTFTLAAGADLNTAIVTGVYNCPTPTNAPDNAADWQLFVSANAASNPTEVVQIAMRPEGSEWRRSYNSGVWTNWRLVISDDSAPFQRSVKSLSTAVPGAPAVGDRYIVPVGATGAWASKDNSIATYLSTGWAFVTPLTGWQTYVGDLTALYMWNGTIWTPAPSSAVTTVFGRGGTVVATAGDYDISKIYNVPMMPQGRLTNSTGVPVVTSSVAGATSVYYTPYIGQIIPLWDGTRWIATGTGGELSCLLSDATKSPAAAGANLNYDLFVWSDAGTIRLSRGPSWTSDTSRGSGAGTTELQRVNGLLTNKQAITNGPVANRGTYVGTIRTNASNQVDMIFGGAATGGTAASMMCWNMYHRKVFPTFIQDSGASYTYSSSSGRGLRGSTNMAAYFVRGLSEDLLTAQAALRLDTTANAGSFGVLAFVLDGGAVNAITCTGVAATAAVTTVVLEASLAVAVGAGYHTLTATESSDGTHANTFSGGTLITKLTM